MRVRFGSYVLDDQARQLERDRQPVHLTPKALELLELLVERRPSAVSKAEIASRLWPDTYVAEVNLPVLVHELRECLQDDPREPRFVRTVPRFGYAFCGAAQPEAETPQWAKASPFVPRVVWEEREIPLQPGDNLLGRTHDATVRVDHSSVSRRHAVVRVTEEGATLEDCGSRNGTFLGSARIEAAHPLEDGDRILLGQALLVFRRIPRAKTPTTCCAPSEEPLPDPESLPLRDRVPSNRNPS